VSSSLLHRSASTSCSGCNGHSEKRAPRDATESFAGSAKYDPFEVDETEYEARIDGYFGDASNMITEDLPPRYECVPTTLRLSTSEDQCARTAANATDDGVREENAATLVRNVQERKRGNVNNDCRTITQGDRTSGSSWGRCHHIM
jgi:hypothetical protein